MASSRKEALEKEKKVLFGKDFVTKNPVLAVDHIEELFHLFNLYADARTKRVDARDILVTARTLGLNEKYAFVFKALEEVTEGEQGTDLDFETFVKELTAKIVQFGLELGQSLQRGGSTSHFPIVGRAGKGGAGTGGPTLHQRTAEVRVQGRAASGNHQERGWLRSQEYQPRKVEQVHPAQSGQAEVCLLIPRLTARQLLN